MDVKAAVQSALQYVSDLFLPESISNVGLEEVEFDDATNQWLVTVGFSRPWDYPKNALANSAGVPHRSYKSVILDDRSGKVVAIRNYESKSVL